MSYIEKNLMINEKIVYWAKLHWITFFWPTFWLLITLTIVVFGIRAEVDTKNLSIVAGIPLAISALTCIRPFIDYKTSEFGITNKRVVVKKGFIKRESLEVLLHKVEGIQVDQGIWGRILGYGSIVVSGTGGAKDPFYNIAAPLKFRKKVQEQISKV